MIGPGVSARRIAERITALSGGALTIDVFAAGEIVPALNVFDAVATATVEMGHTAALFWGGKMPVAPVFTTFPFGPDAAAHQAWLLRGGQTLWDELYAPHNVKPLLGGNTGPSAAGWFRKEVRTLDDLKGLRIRATGLGGELYAALGATPIAVPPADTYAALERGVVDAVELLAPVNDAPLGFSRIAPFYVFPGFNKPNGASELLIGRTAWNGLGKDLQTLIETVAAAEHALAVTEAHAANATALQALAASGTRVVQLDPASVMRAMPHADAIMQRVAATGPLAARIIADLQAWLPVSQRWRSLSGGPK